MNKKNLKKKVSALLLWSLFALMMLELSLRFFGFWDDIQKSAFSKKSSSSFTILNIGNSPSLGVGNDYSTQLQIILDKKNPGYYAVANESRENANTRFIKENISDWLKKYRPNIVFLMVGKSNEWNKYGYLNFLEERNESNLFQFKKNEDLKFLGMFKLGQLILKSDKARSGFSSTLKSISLKDSPRLLGYTWLGHLERGAIYQTKKLTEAQGEEAISALKYIYSEDQNPVAARLIAAINLQVFHKEDVFLEYLEKSLKLQKEFNYETWHFLKMNESLMGEKSLQYVQEYLKGIDQNKLELKVKEIESWYSEKKSVEADFLIRLNRANPTDMRIVNDLSKKDVNPDLLIEAAERSLLLNPLSPEADVLDTLGNVVKKRPEIKEKYLKLVEQTNNKIGKENYYKLKTEIELEKDWIINDLEDIINTIELTGAKVIVQTYGPYHDDSSHLSDDFLRQWWKLKPRPDIQFMDIENITKESPGPVGHFEIAKLMEKYVL